jgi:nitrite reductase/ring-hydroxylating ferredoxin subunit
MLVPFLSVSTSIVGLLSWLIRKQYRRVQQRDIARRRIQPYQSSLLSPISKPDPLDHSLYWYPVAFSHEITCDQSQPFGFHLLNEPLCLYRTKDEQVVCVLDRCVHRLAPLSSGRMTKAGNLECIYHGWQYGANGRCVYIPSVSKNSNIAFEVPENLKFVSLSFTVVFLL